MLTARASAKHLGVSLRLVYQLCRELVIPHRRSGNALHGRILIDEADVEHYRRLCLVDAADLLPVHFFLRSIME